MKNKENPKILRNPNFRIDMNMNIFDKDGNRIIPFKINGNLYINLDNIIYNVNDLYLETYFGVENIVKMILNEGLKISYSNENVLYIENVEFRRIIGEEKYFISKQGTVITFKKYKYGKILKRQISENGYFVIHVRKRLLKLHREVYKAYNGEILPGLIIDHLDGNKFNPNLNNLEMITPGENTRRSLTMGLQSGKRWDEKEIHDICSLLEKNTSLNTLYEIYSNKASKDQLKMLIHMLRNNKLFTDITRKYNLKDYKSYLNKKDRKLSESDVIYIRENSKKMTLKSLAEKFNVSPNTIASIINRTKWKHVQ